MIGELVPLVMIPRFTSYIGEGEYATIPLDVSGYAKATLEFWRGDLQAKQTGADFKAHFEEASEADAAEWTALVTPIESVKTNSLVAVSFSRRFFRIRIELGNSDTGGLVAITCWAAGSLERRVEAGGGR
jgi:hypothetical protein